MSRADRAASAERAVIIMLLSIVLTRGVHGAIFWIWAVNWLVWMIALIIRLLDLRHGDRP